MKLNLYRITVKNYAEYHVEAHNFTDAITNFESWISKSELNIIQVKDCDDDISSIYNQIIEITKLNVSSYDNN
jgi:hypothetical protein